jgi:hypothetical protein
MQNLQILHIIHTPNAILRTFGEIVAVEVEKYLAKGEKVVLSFEGLKGITSSFTYASIGNLYEKFGAETKNLLTLQGIEKAIWQTKIDDAIELALDKEAKKIHEQCLLELFD